MDPVDGTTEVEATVDQPTVEPSESALNPAWSDVLNVIPEAFVPLVTPHLSKWDANFQKVQDSYKPFEPFVNDGVSPEDIQNALSVLNVLNNNPRAVYDRMVDTFGEEWGLSTQQPIVGVPSQGQVGSAATAEEVDFGDYSNIENHPRFQELLNNQKAIAEFFVSQRQQEENAAADAQLEQELTTLRSKHGDFDEQIVLSLAAGGMSLEAAVQKYASIANSVRQQTTNKNFPQIVPTGGSVPSQAVDVASLSDKDTRGLALAFLNANKG